MPHGGQQAGSCFRSGQLSQRPYHGGVLVAAQDMHLLFQHAPGLGIIASGDKEHAAGKADLVGKPQPVKDTQATALRKQAILRLQSQHA